MYAALLPFLLLTLALSLILASTIQFRRLRLPIWLIGVGVLISCAITALGQPGHYGFLAFLRDAVQHPSDSVAAHAITHGWRNIADALLPTIDVFLILAAAFAILALASMTPGEKTEKVIRPFMWMLLGGVGGALLVVSLVSVGLGGYPKSRVYAAFANDSGSTLTSVRVIDGDTLVVGEVPLRLAGVDAPEYHQRLSSGQRDAREQLCIKGAEIDPCGENARNAMISLIRGALVYCQQPDWNGRSFDDELAEALGRPLVQCWVFHQRADSFDLARRLAECGQVDQFIDRSGRRGDQYGAEVARARAQKIGMWDDDRLVTPAQWRADGPERAELERYLAQLDRDYSQPSRAPSNSTFSWPSSTQAKCR